MTISAEELKQIDNAYATAGVLIAQLQQLIARNPDHLLIHHYVKARDDLIAIYRCSHQPDCPR